MTQLEEYLERRSILRARMDEYRAAAFDQSLPTGERRGANKKFNQYSEMLEELDEQIRALDPKAIPPSRRKARLGNASLNKEISTGKEMLAFISSEPEQEDDCEKTLNELWREKALVAARYLPPRQAEALDLRFNDGYSLQKVADTMGVTVNTAFRHIKAGNRKLENWMAIAIATGGCTVSDSVFMFDEFLEMAPHAFPRSLREILLVLYQAPASRYKTVSALAKENGWNYAQTSRRLGWIKNLCELYGIPLAACHPLVQRSKAKKRHLESAFRQFEGFRTSTYGYRRTARSPDESFRARERVIRHHTVEEAVRDRLLAEYGVTEADSDLIAEGLKLFDGERLQLARERIDGGKTLNEVRENSGHAAGQIREVVTLTALYVYFRLDLRRIFHRPDPWRELFARWQCFPPGQEKALRLLLDRPSIRSVRALARELCIAEAGALRFLRKIAWYAVWWDIPTETLPRLVRLHLGDGIRITRSTNTFRRTVALRHAPGGEAEKYAGTQEDAGCSGGNPGGDGVDPGNHAGAYTIRLCNRPG